MKTRKLCILMMGMLLLPIRMRAQIDSSNTQGNYLRFKEQALSDYYNFKSQSMNDFERFIAETWKEYKSFTEKQGAYSAKKPETLPSLSVSSNIIDVDAPFLNSQMIYENWESEQPKNTIVYPSQSQGDIVPINFYGRHLEFEIPNSLRIKAKGIKEKQIAKYHEEMRQNDTEHILQKQLDDAVSLMGLNEWGYFILLRSISEAIFQNANDRVLFSFYMLHSHGFKARVGRGSMSGQLLLLLAIDNQKEVYSQTFYRINDTKYYKVYGNSQKDESVYTYDEKADDKGLKEIGLDFTNTLSIAACDKTRKLHLNKANMDIELPYSTAHLRYYDEIPTTVFPIYFKTAVSKEAEQVLEQTFNTLAKTYNKVQLVDIMLNFVQTAFPYKIDELQFGHEKYFFPEEVIGYPFSDCEDRSALFAWLIQRYIGYDVVGVLYDDHLATGVCFGNDAQIEGKSVMLKGKRYVVCDPTYSNAPIGTVMPKFANANYEIVKIN